MDQLEKIFAKANLRLTKPRRTVFQLLQKVNAPITTGGIIQQCPQVDRTTIYRVLETFQKLGVITIVHVGWKNYYELADPFIPHHHHLYCQKCYNAVPLEDPEIEQFIQHIAHKYNFVAIDHHFELEGICRDCQKLSQQKSAR